MIIFDAHNDLFTSIIEKNEDIDKNTCHIDLEKIQYFKNEKIYLGCAIFTDDDLKENQFQFANSVIDNFYNQISKYKIHQNLKFILTMENGTPLMGNPNNVRHFHDRGVRAISLTWNNTNELCGGCNDHKIGVSNIGNLILDEIYRLGMILDFSHISEKGFYDCCEKFAGKVIASHSNAQKLCNHKRNLTDEQIKILKDRDGVIGINLYPPFLNENGNAEISDIIRHIEYISSVASTSHVGFGFDFDGVEYLPNGINNFKDIHKIIDELERLNYSNDDILNICGRNFLRMFS